KAFIDFCELALGLFDQVIHRIGLLRKISPLEIVRILRDTVRIVTICGIKRIETGLDTNSVQMVIAHNRGIYASQPQDRVPGVAIGQNDSVCWSQISEVISAFHE